MGRSLSILDRVRVAAPCTHSWSKMTGDDRVRHCDACKLKVYNLTEMTKADAEALVLAREGRLCIRYHARADCTIISRGGSAPAHRLC